jgi:hypothetical protein
LQKTPKLEDLVRPPATRSTALAVEHGANLLKRLCATLIEVVASPESSGGQNYHDAFSRFDSFGTPIKIQ